MTAQITGCGSSLEPAELDTAAVCDRSFATSRGRLLECRSLTYIYVAAWSPAHPFAIAAPPAGNGAIPEKSCVRQRTDLWIAADDTAVMPQFSLPNSHSHETFLSPRKSLLAVGVMCALSAVALLTGRTPAATPAPDVDKPTQQHADPDLYRPAPHRR
jgi:hypothetical protein